MATKIHHMDRVEGWDMNWSCRRDGRSFAYGGPLCPRLWVAYKRLRVSSAFDLHVWLQLWIYASPYGRRPRPTSWSAVVGVGGNGDVRLHSVVKVGHNINSCSSLKDAMSQADDLDTTSAVHSSLAGVYDRKRSSTLFLKEGDDLHPTITYFDSTSYNKFSLARGVYVAYDNQTSTWYELHRTQFGLYTYLDVPNPAHTTWERATNTGSQLFS